MKLIIPELLYTGGEFKKEYAVMIEGRIEKRGRRNRIFGTSTSGVSTRNSQCTQSLFPEPASRDCSRPAVSRVERQIFVSLFSTYDVGRYLQWSAVRVW